MCVCVYACTCVVSSLFRNENEENAKRDPNGKFFFNFFYFERARKKNENLQKFYFGKWEVKKEVE